MSVKLLVNYFSGGLILLFLLVTPTFTSESVTDRGASITLSEKNLSLSNNSSQSFSTDKAAYNCILRIFIVEPLSQRYYNSKPPAGYYEFGFLDFAVDEELHILDEHSGSVTWDGDVRYFSNLSETNIMAIAALYNLDDAHDAYADPPAGRPFTAYYVDATVAATPGNPGDNSSGGDYSHTILVEEFTATY
jgi:hypothetical protein